MTLELSERELKAVKTLVNAELEETKDLINNTTLAADDFKNLSNYYDTLYMIKQKLAKE